MSIPQDHGQVAVETLVLISNAVHLYTSVVALCDQSIMENVSFYLDPVVNELFAVKAAVTIVDSLDPGNGIHAMLFDTATIEDCVRDLQLITYNSHLMRLELLQYLPFVDDDISQGLTSTVKFLVVLTRSDGYRCQLNDMLAQQSSLKVLQLGIESENAEETDNCKLLVKQMCIHRCDKHSNDMFVKLRARKFADVVKLSPSKISQPKKCNPVTCAFGKLCVVFFQTLKIPGNMCKHHSFYTPMKHMVSIWYHFRLFVRSINTFRKLDQISTIFDKKHLFLWYLIWYWCTQQSAHI